MLLIKLSRSTISISQPPERHFNSKIRSYKASLLTSSEQPTPVVPKQDAGTQEAPPHQSELQVQKTRKKCRNENGKPIFYVQKCSQSDGESNFEVQTGHKLISHYSYRPASNTLSLLCYGEVLFNCHYTIISRRRRQRDWVGSEKSHII